MEITCENAELAISMMKDAADIKNYNTAITMCNELILIKQDDPVVNFYWGFLATISRDFFATTTFEVLEKQLDKAAALLANASYPIEEKISIYKDFIVKTIRAIEVYISKGFAHKKHTYTMYASQLSAFIGKIRKVYLLENPYDLDMEWIIDKGEQLFNTEFKFLDDYTYWDLSDSFYMPNHNGIGYDGRNFIGLPDNLKEVGEFVIRYMTLQKKHSIWQKATGQITDEMLKEICLKEFREAKKYYDKRVKEYNAKKELLDKKMSSFFGRMNPSTRKQYKKLQNEDIHNTYHYNDCAKAYKQFVEDKKFCIKKDFDLHGRNKNQLWWIIKESEEDPGLWEKAKKIAKDYLENEILPEELK